MGVSRMQAIEYRFSVPRYLLSRAVGKRSPSVHYGRFSSIRLTHLPKPSLKGPEWAKLRPIASGICGTDIGIITGQASPSLEPFSSFPAVLGHEILASVDELGGAIDDISPEQRVVVDPFLHCRVRGLPPCANCVEGRTSLCRNMTAGDLAPAMIMGTCRDLLGGWTEQIVAHRSQLFPVPAEISDDKAVLIEPLSVSLHAVLIAPPPAGSTVLVIGGGTVGLCTVAALRLLGITSHITLLARYEFQRQLGVRLGADETPPPGSDKALELVEARMGARLLKPTLGRRVPDWGFDYVYDCVGAPNSLDDALRTTRSGGTLVLLGGAGEIRKLDWAFVWAKEMRVLGSCGYGLEAWRGQRCHTFEVAMQLLRENPDYPLHRLISHRYPLAEYQTAFQTVLDRRTSQATKVLFTNAS